MPNSKEHSPRSVPSDEPIEWSVKCLRIGSDSGPAQIQFTFPVKGGRTCRLRIPYGECRHPVKLLDRLSDRVPVFPPAADANDKSRIRFIRELVDSYDLPFDILPDRTGFLDAEKYATHAEIIRRDGTRTPIDLLTEDPLQYADVRGTRDGTIRDVLEVARHSTYLAFGIGVALAAPLPTYLKLHAGDNSDAILTETAIFNFSGTSSSGKSTICRAAVSLGASPERIGIFNFTSRGLAELAADSNDLLLVLDDTESHDDSSVELVKALRTVVQTIPGGRSKIISRGVDQTLPQLRWSTFGLSSSPHSIAMLAKDHHWEMTAGDRVRLFNIRVPGPAKGGIFDRIDKRTGDPAAVGINLIKRLERGYRNNCGHIIPEWVLYLLRKDRSARIAELMRRFSKRVAADQHGWEHRFAAKFGIIYAALVLGIDAGLLPWDKKFVRRVVTRCYRSARTAAQSDTERDAALISKLIRLLRDSDRIVQVRDTRAKRTPIIVPPQCVAIQFEKSSRLKYGILDRAIVKMLGSRRARSRLTRWLADQGLIPRGHGNAGTTQERIPIRVDGIVIERPRLWVLDAKAWEKCTSQIERE